MSDVKRFRADLCVHPIEAVSAADYDLLHKWAVGAQQQIDAYKAEAQALREELAALRARVVVIPERKTLPDNPQHWQVRDVGSWNACLTEIARLNGKVVSEGLLRGLVQAIERIVHDERVPNEVSQEVAEMLILAKRSLLDEGKEDGYA